MTCTFHWEKEENTSGTEKPHNLCGLYHSLYPLYSEASLKDVYVATCTLTSCSNLQPYKLYPYTLWWFVPFGTQLLHMGSLATLHLPSVVGSLTFQPYSSSQSNPTFSKFRGLSFISALYLSCFVFVFVVGVSYRGDVDVSKGCTCVLVHSLGFY